MQARERPPGERASDSPHPPPTGPLRRAFYLTVGWISVGLALAGIPLPILPTTPFLLLAAACFLRSSPRLHRRLLENERLGPYLVQWQRDRSVPRGAKLRAQVLVALTFTISIVWTDRALLRIALGVLGVGLLVFLASLKTGPRIEPRPLADEGRSG